MDRNLGRKASRIGRNFNIALRAERMIARRRLAVFRNQTGLMVFAGLMGGIGVVMLNVAAFFSLTQTLSYGVSGLIVAAVNFALAVVVALFASRMSAETELAPVAELRDLAIEDIEAELGDAMADINEVAQDVRRIARDPFGAALPNLIAPAISLLVKNLKK